jgi:hypothetical protein
VREKESYIFKEKFAFQLHTGFEELTVKIYSITQSDEKEEEEHQVKVAE